MPLPFRQIWAYTDVRVAAAAPRGIGTHPVNDPFIAFLVRLSPQRVDTPDGELFLELLCDGQHMADGSLGRLEHTHGGETSWQPFSNPPILKFVREVDSLSSRSWRISCISSA